MARAVLIALVAAGLAGCGASERAAADSAPAAAAAAAAPALAVAVVPGVSAVANKAAMPAPSPAPPDGRGGELTNPDDAVIVLLYHDLSGGAAPIAAWVEKDMRMQQA